MAVDIKCPVVTLDEWKALVDAIGESKAYVSWFRSGKILDAATARKVLGLPEVSLEKTIEAQFDEDAKSILPANSKKVPPNSSFVRVVNIDGVCKGYVFVPHDGTPEGAVKSLAKAQEIARRNFAWKDEYYNIESQNGATDENGKLKWVISPNRLHVAEPTTAQARYILGDLSAAPKPLALLEQPVKSPAEVLTSAKQVKVTGPEGSTMIRVTGDGGKVSISRIADASKGDNIFRGVKVEKIEAGIIGKDKKFKAMDGDVTVTDRNPPKPPPTAPIEEAKPAAPPARQFVNGNHVKLSGGDKFHNDIAGMIYQVHNDGKVLDVIKDGTDYPVRVTVEDYQNVETGPVEPPKVETPKPSKLDEIKTKRKEIQDRLRKKFGQTNSLVDPEIATIATELAVNYAQEGVVRFTDFAKRVKSEMPDLWEKVKGYLHGAWASAGQFHPGIEELNRIQSADALAKIDAEQLLSSPKPIEKITPIKEAGNISIASGPPAEVFSDTLGNVIARKPSLILGIGSAEHHFTLWYRIGHREGMTFTPRWHYLSILGGNQSEAFVRATETAKRIAAGDLTGIAFLGTDKIQPADLKDIGLAHDPIAKEQLLGVDRVSIGEQGLNFGKKYPTLKIKDLWAKDPSYAEWIINDANGKRAEQIRDYITSLPEYIASKNAAPVEAREALDDNAKKLLADHTMVAEVQNNGDVLIRGAVTGKETYGYKDSIKSFGGKFDAQSQSWRLKADGFKRFITNLASVARPTGRQGIGVPSYLRDPVLGSLRQAADALPDRSGFTEPISEYISPDTEALLRRGLTVGMPPIVVDEQIEDVARMSRVHKQGGRLYLLASEPGSGKTFVGGGFIREARKQGAKKIGWVTLRDDLINQIKDDLKDYNIGDVTFTTYTRLRKMVPEDFDVLIFDESHSAKNVNGEGDNVSQQAQAAKKFIERAKMTVLMSATPFENPVQAAYLEPTGVFDHPFGNFRNFALAHGATAVKRTVPTPYGPKEINELVWKRTTKSDEDSKAARNFWWKLGIYTSRKIRLNPDSFDSRLVKVHADQGIADMYAKFTEAAEEKEDNLGSNAIMWVTNFQKRILESGKVQAAINEAQSAIKRGRWPIIFVETKAERIINIPHMIEQEAEWAAAAARAQAMRDIAPPRSSFGLPPIGITDVLASFMQKTGIKEIRIPSAEDLIQKHFGADNVDIYTGSVSPVKAAANLLRWRQSKTPRLLVATLAKGGAGLSVHDKVGNHQTTQINMNMPWTATGVIQVAQRSARYGLKGKAEMQWLFADNIPFDQMLAARVGGRMADMGSVVQGQKLAGAQEIETWDFNAVPFSEISKMTSGEQPDQKPPQAALGERRTPEVARPAVTAQSPEELRAALPTSGLNEEQQGLIRAFLDSPLAKALDGVRVKIADTLRGGWQGSYFDGMVELARNADPKTAPHEFAHRVWELMPQEIRDQFEKMRVDEIDRMLKGTNPYQHVIHLEQLRDRPTSGGEQFLSRGYARELYHLSSAEEFFTHSFSDRFVDRLDAKQRGIWAQAKALFQSVIAAVKKFAGLDQSKTQLLDNIMAGRYELTPEGNAATEYQASLPKESAIPEDDGNWVDTVVNGTVLGVRGKEGTFSPESTAASRVFAKGVFDELGVPVTEESHIDTRQPGNPEIKFWRMDSTGNDNTLGQKLADRLTSLISEWRTKGTTPDQLTSLLQSVRINFTEGTMPMFDEPIRQQLFNITHGEVSWAAAFLGSFAQHAKELTDIAKNIPMFLGRARYDAFGGDAYDSFFKRLLTHFRDYFSDKEIEDIKKLNPTVEATLNKIIGVEKATNADWLYRAVQRKLSPKTVTDKQLVKNALFQEELNTILQALKSYGIEEPPKADKLSALEKLRLMVTDKNKVKINDAIHKAIETGEIEAGKQAARNELAGDQEAVDALEQRWIDGEMPTAEQIETGLQLKAFEKWARLRDKWSGYDPVTVKLARQVVAEDFKGLRFGENQGEKPLDTRISITNLAKQPDDEIQRVLDAYTKNVSDNIAMQGVSDATKSQVAGVIKEELLKQINDVVRPRIRNLLFELAKKPELPTPEQRAAQLINAKLFADERLDLPEMVDRLASKSAMKNLMPTLGNLTQTIMATPFFRRSELKTNFIRHLVDKLNVPPEQAEAAWKVFNAAYDARFKIAAQKAFERSRQNLTPRERLVLPATDTAWKRIERAVNSGVFDSAEHLKEKAKEEGWIEPDEKKVAAIREMAMREQDLRTPLPAEVDKIKNNPDLTDAEKNQELALLQKRAEKRLEYERGAIIRKIAAEWSSMTRPINFLKHRIFGVGLPGSNSAIARNNARALNEYETLDMLMKVGFMAFRLLMHIATQTILHTATRSMGRAALARENAIQSGMSRPAIRAIDTQFWRDAADALSESVKASWNAKSAALLQARAEMLGRGEARNVDRIMSGINSMERLAAKANAEKDAGRPWNAALLHLLNAPRVVQWYIGAIDHLQGKPTEYQEIIDQIDLAMRNDGRTSAEIKLFKDEVFDAMRTYFPVAVAEVKSFAEAKGVEKTAKEIEEEATNLVARKAYEMAQRIGLPADEFEKDINLLKSTVSWQEATNKGVGGAVASMLKTMAGAGEELGLPTSITRLANAIGTGINYMLMNTPFYKLANVGKGPDSPWFRTKLDREQRKMQAIIGTMFGATVIAMISARAMTPRLFWPSDKKKREAFEMAGHRPGTVEINLPDGSFIPISLTVGPMSLLAPYVTAAGGVNDFIEARNEQEQRLIAEAKAKGIAPGKLPPISSGDLLAIAGKAMMGMIINSRTAGGLVASGMEQGIPNLRKFVAGFVSPLIPGLPMYQEISRMMGVNLNTKLASVGDYLVPLPTSPHRLVNALGDPVETPNDIQRIIQVITAGSYPFAVDPNDKLTEDDARSQAAYTALFATDYRPPSINPSKGYNINGNFRPMTSDELEKYTVLRGQYLKSALADMGANPTSKQVKSAYTVVNDEALAAVGVKIVPSASKPVLGRPAAFLAQLGGVQTKGGKKRVSIKGRAPVMVAPKIHVTKLRRPRLSLGRTSRHAARAPKPRLTLARSRAPRLRLRRPRMTV